MDEGREENVMTVKECYEQMQGNYEEVLGRLGSEAMVLKYAKKFLADESCRELTAAMEAKDYAEAFKHVHNLKGVCLNLAFTGLCESSAELCDALRSGEPVGDVEGMFSRVEEDYARVIAAIQQL